MLLEIYDGWRGEYVEYGQHTSGDMLHGYRNDKYGDRGTLVIQGQIPLSVISDGSNSGG